VSEWTGNERGARIASLYGERLVVLKAGLQAADAVILGALLFFGLLIVVFRSRVPAPGRLLLWIAVLSALYIGSIYLLPRLSNRVLIFFVRTAAVQLLCGQLFFIAEHLQMIAARGWQDPAVLSLEKAVFGVQPTVWLQRFVSPPLTEWMMFAYVIYLVIYPGLGALIYFRRGEKPLEDYLFVLAVTNVACFLGFIVFPVAGPLYFQPDAYTVPLKGGFFTACGEFIRKNLHVIGGNLPSPHCAIATVMWMMARRYVRAAFYILAPVILSLYVSTFFLRYHYVTDSVLGILTAALVIFASPALVRAWNAAIGRGEGRR
jgi:hypothetical protein